MKNKTLFGLGALFVLLIGVVIGVSVVLLMRTTDTTEPTENVALKIPPDGETFATGHWDGDKWHRTVPPNPETLTYKGEELLLYQFYNACFDTSWEERVVMMNRLIAEAPYSMKAHSARYYLATHDENEELIFDDPVLFERLKPLLKYHPSSPFLLHSLLKCRRKSHPEEAIQYGKEALKYVDPLDSNDRRLTPQIHHTLGYAYEERGDYDAALEHYNQALVLYKDYPELPLQPHGDDVRAHIKQIHKGNPYLGPLSDGSAPSSLPTRAPEPSPAGTE